MRPLKIESVLNALCLAQRIGTFTFWFDSSLKILYKEREKCFLVLKTSGGARELERQVGSI